MKLVREIAQSCEGFKEAFMKCTQTVKDTLNSVLSSLTWTENPVQVSALMASCTF